MASATDIPGKFDVLINGEGYVFVEPAEDGRAIYGYSPTFIDRQNTGANYGDDTSDFFLTVAQTDWSLGEGRKFGNPSDPVVSRQFWAGTNVDPISIPGQVSQRYSMASVTFSEAVVSCAALPSGNIFAAGATKGHEVTADGTVTDRGAHSLSAAPGRYGMWSDGTYVFLTYYGATAMRYWTGAAWASGNISTGTEGEGCQAYVSFGNSLYGYDSDTAANQGGLILPIDGGTATVIYTWKDSSNDPQTGTNYAGRLLKTGGSVLLLKKGGKTSPYELWEYDGTNTFLAAAFPANFTANDAVVAGEVTYVGGYFSETNNNFPAVMYYSNGTLGELWRSKTTGYTNDFGCGVCWYNGGVVFNDDSTGKLMYYDLASGGFHSLASYTVENAYPQLAANADFVLLIRNGSTTGWRYPSASIASTSTVISSLQDFGNSLTKLFRGVKVDFETASGASVDIAYQVDSVDSSWTTLQSGAVSGTEYTLSGVSGQSIAIRVTLNKGSSAGPVLKKVYIRGAPLLHQFRSFTYLIDCSGVDGRANIKLRNGKPHGLDGQSMANALVTAISSTSPISITDRFGTFTAVLEPDKCQFKEIRPQEYIATITGRGI